MPIVIRHGGPDATSQFLPGLIAGQNQAQEKERFDLIQKEAERRFMLESEANRRREEAMSWERQDREAQAARSQQEAQARQAAAGLYAGQVGVPPMTGNLGQDAIKAQKYAATQSAVRSIAAVDPAMAERFLKAREEEMRTEGVRSSLAEIGNTIGKRMTEGAYLPRGMDGQPIEDPTYQERAKERLQRLDAASKLEPSRAVQEAQQIAAEDQHDSDEIKARTTLNLNKGRKALKAKESLAVAMQGGAPESRIDKAESIIVGLESGDYDKDLKGFAEDFDMALRGMVKVDLPGMKGVPVPEEWAKAQADLAQRKQEVEIAAAQALADQRKASAGFSNAKTGAVGSNIQIPPRNGVDPLVARERATRIAKDESGAQAEPGAVKARADELLKGPDSKERLLQDIRAGGMTGEQKKARAQALGLSFEELKAALEQK